MEKELASATSTTAIMQAEKSKLQQEVQESKKEQDDLLMLLADQDQKILSLKQRLKDLGETVHSSQQCRAQFHWLCIHQMCFWLLAFLLIPESDLTFPPQIEDEDDLDSRDQFDDDDDDEEDDEECDE